jgi:pimeloyl-ACP methyl ester carboxylesterase
MYTIRSLIFLLACLLSVETHAQASKGVAIGYTSFGTGPEKVIVLHDWNGNHDNYDPVIRYLSGNEFTYVFMDVRGQGLSLGIKGEYTVEEAAQDVFNLADSLGWKQFHVIGHSFTAMVVQLAGGMDKTGRIKSIISVCGLPAQGAPFTKENISFLQAVVNNRAVTEQAMMALTGGQYSANWGKVKAQSYLENAEAGASAAYLNSFSSKDYSAKVKGLKTPILILTAQWDLPVITLSKIKPYFEALDLKNATYVEIKECGHYPNEERPVFLATLLERFLKSHH